MPVRAVRRRSRQRQARISTCTLWASRAAAIPPSGDANSGEAGQQTPTDSSSIYRGGPARLAMRAKSTMPGSTRLRQ